MTTRSGQGDGPPGPGLDVLMSERRQLISLAYRLLGSLAEAELMHDTATTAGEKRRH